MAKTRVPIPDEISAQVLHASDFICCVCNQPAKQVQLHHIDEDPSNNDPENLAVLCFEDHDRTQVSGGFGKKLTAPVVRKYRAEWLERVRNRREAADKAFVARLADVTLPEAPSGKAPESWSAPSEATLFAYINHLPQALEAIHAAEDPKYENGTTGEANEAADKILSELELMWVYLSRWYPPGNFGEESERFIRKFRAQRYNFHGALLYVGGNLHGTMTYRWPAWSTIRDLENMVRSTVIALTRLEPFDLENWLDKWNRASADGPKCAQPTRRQKLKNLLFRKSWR